jgi:lipopolysaccharide biosynthesis glycosyltransferase
MPCGIAKNIPIFMASDESYAAYAASAIASICTNSCATIDFFLLDSGLTELSKERLLNLRKRFANFNLEIIEIDVFKEFKEFKEFKYLTLSTYSRLLIPRFKPELEKLIYLDIDTIALGDVAELYAQDLHGYILGAVRDCYVAKNPVEQISEKQQNAAALITGSHKYFNAGVLLLDALRWRNSGITEKLFEIEKILRNRSKYLDQDFLNNCFANNNYYELPQRFNFTNRFAVYGDVLSNDIIIRHFTTANKPWKSRTYISGKPLDHWADFWIYFRMTNFYIPDMEKELNIC